MQPARGRFARFDLDRQIASTFPAHWKVGPAPSSHSNVILSLPTGKWAQLPAHIQTSYFPCPMESGPSSQLPFKRCCCCCRPHSTNVLPAENSTRNHVAASSLSPQVARKGSTLSGFVQRSRLEREVGRDLHSNKWEEV